MLSAGVPMMVGGDEFMRTQQGNGSSPVETLKRRAELVRLIERAEIDWLAAEEAIEQGAAVASSTR